MQIHGLGSTGLPVSAIGLGLAALGRPGYINVGRESDLGADRSVDAMERRCHEVLDTAYAAGIRYFDAARSYGLAEQFLASWLHARGVPPGSVTIGSKWGYTYTAGWQLSAAQHEVKDLSVGTLDRQVGESRGLLGGSLQLYQIHSATIESGVLDDLRVIDALMRLRSEGLAIGLTVTGPAQADTIRRALDVRADGVPCFQTVQATWNLLDTSAGPALGDAHATGLGVIVKESLANGRLTGRYSGDEVAAARRVADARRVSLDVLAMSAALSQPWADVVLSGAATPQHLLGNVKALEAAGVVKDLPPLALAPEVYWAGRSALAWR